MSGLEPIAALSLACNILQVVGVGRDTVRIAKQVYQDGTLDPALTESAGVLNDLSSQIRVTTEAASAAKPKAQDKQLLDLADKCQRAARDLQEEVNFLNGPPTKAKLVATLKIAAKTTWRKRRLEKLDQRLKDAESFLQTGLLTRIYERSVKTNGDLLALGVDVRAFLEEYRNGRASSIDLMKRHITTETKRSEDAVRSHVTLTSNRAENSLKEHIGIAIRGVANQVQDTRLQAKRDQLLRSLKFDRMNERRNQVSSSHPKTFTWVLQDGSEGDTRQSTVENSEDEDFEDQDWEDEDWEDQDSEEENSEDEDSEDENDADQVDKNISWDSFTDWLRSTEPVYWISGMPGSGKSTLTKYLLGQSQTQECLDLWKPDAIIISHFFWRPGTAMQQSIRGLLFSLLYQILLEDVPAVDEVRVNYDEKSTKDNETDWSDEELKNALHLTLGRYPRPIAIFLDGLDEVLPGDGVLKLLEVVDGMKTLCAHTGTLKICLGSRREPLFCKRLSAYPQLRLEQLNLVDLRRYGRDHVEIPSDYHITGEVQDWPQDQEGFKEWLVNSLVAKAGGVFLWLCLTVSTITKALNEGETVEDLVHLIDNLPQGLADLYADMWARMNHDSDHLKARAASYLQLALEGLEERGAGDFRCPLSPYIMMVATTPGITDLLLQPNPSDQMPAASQILEACEITIRDIANRCGGLLVCPSPTDAHNQGDEELISWHGDEYNSLTPYVSLSGDPTCFFLHRTARDFLTDTEEGQKILSWGSFAGERAALHLVKARLTIYRLFRVPLWIWNDSTFATWSYNNEVSDVFECALFPVRDLGTGIGWKQLNKSMKSEVLKLLLVCEQLFNYGYLCGRPAVAPNPTPLEQDPGNIMYYVYNENTVHRQHEFLLEAAYYAFYKPSFWDDLLPVIQRRKLDDSTMSQLLVCACAFGKADTMITSSSGLRPCLKAIRALVGWGASPVHKTLQRDRREYPTLDYLITTLETPFQTLMTSIWSLATQCPFDNDFAQVLDLVSLFVAHGADLNQEIHMALEVEAEGNRMRFTELWQRFEYSRGLVLIMGYSVSSILANVLKIWQLPDLPQMGWLPDPQEMANSGFGQGHLIALIAPDKSIQETEDHSALDLFVTDDIFPLRSEDGSVQDLLPLLRLLDEEIQDKGVSLLERQKNAPMHSDVDILSQVIIPPEAQAGAARAVQRLRSTTVPVAERRKEVRVRLGICTPLEGMIR
ncbi:NACHT domain-containing protein [Apiospora marii]|uniref:NACHT domain-containing protein n=1 Tax=Apiospora marii TaxID=335849 RepID=A0ABR1RCG3_9PEZI